MATLAADRLIFPDRIPSAVSYAECLRLWDAARGKVVLELGAQWGCSTVCMAQSAEHVVSVDWHRGDYQAGLQDTLPGFWRNLKEYRVDTKVTVIAGSFEKALPLLRERSFDMVFIDGCHDEAAVANDIMLALPLLKRPGMAFFHDYGRAQFPGVRRQVDRLADEHLSNVNVTDTLASVMVTRG